MAQFLIALMAFSLVCLSSAPTAMAGEPLLCRALDNHQVCVMAIKRSAKNYWEYRVQLSIEGRLLPLERYDCRRTLRPSATDEMPSKQSLHQLVCGLVKH